MAKSTRQTNLFAAEDWKKLYTTFSDADFQSYDFETIRKVMVDYLKTYYAEDFNDFIESSEYIALLDLIAFVSQSLAFRTDLNARENFLETAERRDSVIKLVKQLSYQPTRNKTSSGLLKIVSVSTSEQVRSNTGQNLARATVNWNDPSNPDWLNQFTQILNAALGSNQKIGKPYASKTINGIKTEQYNVALPTSVVPVFAYSAPVLESSAPFEVVSSSILASDNILEQDPGIRGQFGMIYQQDGQGFGSANNGFFVLFKQGQLQSLDFTLNEKLPNRIVNVNVDNINNEDVWMYSLNGNRLGEQWTLVPSTGGSNAIYNSVARNIRTTYSVNTRLNDQIDLVFGDGTFSDIPTGSFRSYFRVSNGITYRITPSDMNNISVAIPYISRSGRGETLTITASLQYTVANSSRRDTIEEIKQKAPQNFYTQNRMVNGEDYNILPYTLYPDIVKVKAVNRYSSGISRNLDIIDPTGKYSSTDLIADDGALYKESFSGTKTFTFNTRSDIATAIRNVLLPIVKMATTKHFYFDNFNSITFDNLPTKWERTTDDAVSCTGFFVDNAGNKQQIGEFTSSNRKYLLRNSLIKFTAPAGYYFDVNNVLTPGTPLLKTDKTYIWGSIQSQNGNGTNETYIAGREIGAITLTDNIPTGAIISEVYAPLTSVFSNALVLTITNLIFNNIDFGLRYDIGSVSNPNVDPWKVVSSANLDRTGDFSLNFAGDTSNNAKDSSWIIKLETDGVNYTVTYRGLYYIFASQNKVTFLNSNTRRTYDSKNNIVVKDNIKILNVNTKPGTSDKLDKDLIWEVSDNLVESDGYVDTTKILVTFADENTDGIIDDPTLFGQLSNATTPNVFFKKYFDFDNLIRYELLSEGAVYSSSGLDTKADIELQRNNYPVGSIFYASFDKKFYEIKQTNGLKSVVENTDYKGYVGRQSIYFKYRHNASDNKRIDPASSNLIDLYILTRNYDDAYRAYIEDTTNQVAEPEPVTTFELSNSYGDLFNYKMLTDSLVINSGNYKPLFGSKAVNNLQAKFQVVKNSNSTISDNELKSKIIDTINNYFALENWNFGDTFYFSELSAYLHSELGTDLSSVILVPLGTNTTFGSLYEIRCQPNEIFINAATVDNVEVVSSVLSGINASGINTTTVVKGVTY